jgi:hypothetical protein
VRVIRARVPVIHEAAAPVNVHVKVLPAPSPEKFNTFNTFSTFDVAPSPDSTGRVPTKWVAGGE